MAGTTAICGNGYRAISAPQGRLLDAQMSGANERGTDGVNAPREGPAPPTPIPGREQAHQAALLLQPSLDELRKDIREIRGHGRTEFWLMFTGFAAGFIL